MSSVTGPFICTPDITLSGQPGRRWRPRGRRAVRQATRLAAPVGLGAEPHRTGNGGTRLRDRRAHDIRELLSIDAPQMHHLRPAQGSVLSGPAPIVTPVRLPDERKR